VGATSVGKEVGEQRYEKSIRYCDEVISIGNNGPRFGRKLGFPADSPDRTAALRPSADRIADALHARPTGRDKRMVRNHPRRGFDLGGQGQFIMGGGSPGFRCNRPKPGGRAKNRPKRFVHINKLFTSHATIYRREVRTMIEVLDDW